MINIKISQENSQEIKDTFCNIEKYVGKGPDLLKFDEVFKAVSKLFFQILPLDKDRFIQYVREDRTYIFGNYQNIYATVDKFNSAKSPEDLYYKLVSCEECTVITFFEFLTAYLRSNRKLSTHTDLEKGYLEELHLVFNRLDIILRKSSVMKNLMKGWLVFLKG